MADWNAQKMLDLYVYDYMIRRNMHKSAENFIREAGVTPKTVEITSAEGFLVEWWSMFWDVYTARLLKNTRITTQVSSSEEIEDAENVLPNVRPAPLVPDVNDRMLQNICVAMQMAGLPNLLQTINPTTMSMQDMENLLQSSVSTTMQMADFDPNRLGSTPVSDINATEEQTRTSSMAERMPEQEHLRVPPGDLDYNSHLLNVDQVARVIPSSSSSSYSEKNVNNKRPFSATIEHSTGTSMRFATAGITPHAPIEQNFGTAETGMGEVNKITPQRWCSTGVGRADKTPVSDQQKHFSGSSARSAPDLAAPTKPRIEKNTGKEKVKDEDIELFFSNDEEPG